MLESFHRNLLETDFENLPDREIANGLSQQFLSYGQDPIFLSAQSRILSGANTPNQAMTGYDDVKAELLSTACGVASVLMKISRSARNIGSAAQNGMFRVVQAESPLVFRRYRILGFTSLQDIQGELTLELSDEQLLKEGDTGILRAGAFAHQFLFDPPGVLIHRVHQPAKTPFVHNFDSETLAYLHSSFASQEITRDHFFVLLTRHLSSYLADIYQDSASDEERQRLIVRENNNILDYLRTAASRQDMNAASRWLAVQSLSLFRPEEALGELKAMRQGGSPNIASLAGRSEQRLESYLASAIS